MTPEKTADEIIAKYGFPQNREMLHAMLAFAYSWGKRDAGDEICVALKNGFSGRQERAS